MGNWLTDWRLTYDNMYIAYIQKRIANVTDFLATHFRQSLFSEKPTYQIPIGSNDD